jgi:AbrB family looped-hinge helix DNA binding protein
MHSVVMAKRGAVVIPAKMRKRFNSHEGSAVVLEEREDGILLRPAPAALVDVEIYTPERLAESFLNNVMDKEGYLEARKDAEHMGIDRTRLNPSAGRSEPVSPRQLCPISTTIAGIQTVEARPVRRA